MHSMLAGTRMRACSLLFVLSLAAFENAAAQSAPLQIEGAPTLTVRAGQLYDFWALASGGNGAVPRFEIQNKPSWMFFMETDGLMAGVPAAGDVGTYADITVCATDGTARSCLPAFSITVNPPAHEVMLEWEAPTHNVDGSPLTDLAGFLVYAGRTAEELIPMVSLPSPDQLGCVVEMPEPGEYVFAVKALTLQGMRSEFSAIVKAMVE